MPTPDTATQPQFATYAAVKRDFLHATGALQAAVADSPAADLVPRLALLAERVEGDRFHLAVVGQFKRGKTTVINSLLGASVLPTGIVPLTSIVTLVEYGAEPTVTVHFDSRETKSVPLTEVAAYVTERDNPQNVKHVARVEVTYPAAVLRDGVVLIDTPGIGSTYEHNTDVAYGFLPQVDAAIFVASVDPPLSRAEKDFLIAIREYAAKLFFVLNKVDYVTAPEQRELLEFVRGTLATELGIVEPKIFPISAKRALEAAVRGSDDGGLPAFRSALEHFLLQEKGRVALTAVSGAALRLVGEARLLLDLERRALATPIEELERKLVEFDRLQAQAEADHRDFQHLLKAETAQLLAVLDDELAALKAEQTPLLEQALRAFADAHPDLKGRALAGVLQEELKRVLIDRFEGWRRAKEQRLGAEFRRLSARFVAAANAIIARVVALSAALFDLPPVPLASVEGLSAESRLYYMVGDQPVLLSIEPIYFSSVLPGRLTRRFVLADALKHVPIEADRNCGRLRYDFLRRVEQSVNHFSQQLTERMQRTLANIRTAIEAGTTERARSGDHAATHQAVIAARLAQLSAVAEQLEAVRTRALDL